MSPTNYHFHSNRGGTAWPQDDVSALGFDGNALSFINYNEAAYTIYDASIPGAPIDNSLASNISAPLSPPSMPTPDLTFTWAGTTQAQQPADGTIAAGRMTPPDCNIAAGSTCIITVVNDHIDIYNKIGTELSGQSLNAFFNLPSSNFVFDPRVTWDQYYGRFIVVADDQTGSNSVIHIAVSKDGNPLDGWWTYNINVKIGNSWLDQPNVGVDGSSLYFNGNYYDLSTKAFTQSVLWAFDVNTLAAGQAVTPYSYSVASLGAPPSDLFQYAPAHMYGGGLGLSGDFLVSYSQNNLGNDTLNIIRVSNAAQGTATYKIQSLNVGDISDAPPANARQLGTSATIDVEDIADRIQDVVWRGDKLYAVNEIRIGSGSNAHDVVHWFVVDTSNPNNLQLLSQGNIDYGSNYDTYYGNMTVDNAGNMIIGYSYSGPSVYASSVYAVMPAGATALQDGGVYLAQGQGTYTNDRWGDYSGIAIDPTDEQSFWVFNEYATSSNSWATTIGGHQVAHSIFPFSNDPESQVEMIYIAYFGRAGDPNGTNFWVNQLTLAGDTVVPGLTGIAAAFSRQSESFAQYPLLVNPSAASQADIQTFINAIYQNLFGHQADANGLAYWAAEVNAIIATKNALTIANGIGQMAVSIALGAQGSDQATLANKDTVAVWLTQQFDAAGVGSFGTQSAAFAFAHTLIASVTSNPASVSAAEVQQIPSIASPVEVMGVPTSSGIFHTAGL